MCKDNSCKRLHKKKEEKVKGHDLEFSYYYYICSRKKITKILTYN